jgi:hypothetical protein
MQYWQYERRLMTPTLAKEKKKDKVSIMKKKN